MKYREILPGDRLKPYVKCFFLFESDMPVEIEDIVFPSGYMEFVFNLGDGIWETAKSQVFSKTPPIELWGQLSNPLAVKAKGKNAMLGIRFFTHSAGYFLKEDLWELTNQVTDFGYLGGEAVRELHARLIETRILSKQIPLIENFLLKRLAISERKSEKIKMIEQVIEEITSGSMAAPVEKIAHRHRITPRYMQKLFLQHAGLTPKLVGKISRFQRSLRLVSKNDSSLTSIAYDCGYFDQSHFIREFKSFTSFTPSEYSTHQFPISAALSNS